MKSFFILSVAAAPLSSFALPPLAENLWQHPMSTLTFRGETLENIAHTLERYYNTRIVFESEALKLFRFTGTPANTSIESVLHILSLTSPLAYEITDTTIVLREDTRRAAHYRNAMKITE